GLPCRKFPIDRTVFRRLMKHCDRSPPWADVAGAASTAPRYGRSRKVWALGSANPGAFYFVVLKGNTRNTLNDHEQECRRACAMSSERAQHALISMPCVPLLPLRRT